MSDQWLTAENFERTNELISALNTLSIYTKLVLSGNNDSVKHDDVNTAKFVLTNFLEKFSSLVSEVINNEHFILGSDPKLNQLAKNYLSEKQYLPSKSFLYKLSISDLKNLMESSKPEDMQNFVDCLKELRCLIEENAQSDFTNLLGEI